MRLTSKVALLPAFSIAAFSCAFALVACTDGSNADPAPGPDSGTVTPDAGEQPPVNTCPAPTAGPTIHDGGDLASDETWTAAGSPHIVVANVSVRNGRQLTIEPCAEVQLKRDVQINVAYPGTPNTGSLVAEGKPGQPITFKGKDGERWASIYANAPGFVRLAHATFENGGGGDFQHGATLDMIGDGEMPADPMLFVDHVTIKGSLGTGVWLQRGAKFLAGSQDLTVTGSGNDEAPRPVEMEEHAIDAFPTGKYTGNKIDEIQLENRGNGFAGSGLVVSGTLHERGVPYHVGSSKGAGFYIGGGEDGSITTLTIEPGVVMKFVEGGSFEVQHFTDDTKPSSAAIIAVGTADKPIVFTSDSATPKAGDWTGLWFGGIPQKGNRIEHARIEYAGYDCGCILNTCSDITESEGAVIFTAQPSSAFIKNTTFRGISMHAITQGYDGTFVDFRPTNTFEDVAGCAQTRPRSADTSCPKPLPACD